MTLELSSQAFSMGGAIPARHTAEGLDLSPPLRWTGVPRATRSLALLVEAPDAPEGGRVHWLAWNLPAHLRGLAEAVAAGDPRLCQGLNDFGRRGWAGPHPPCRKGARRYLFRLWALDAFLDLPEGAGREPLEAAMQGHVLAEARLMGKSHRLVCACASSGAGCSRDSGCERH